MGRILDQRDAEAFRCGRGSPSLVEPQGPPARVGEVGHQIADLGAGARSRGPAQPRKGAIGRLVGVEGLQGTEIGRPSGEHDVARRDEQLAQKVQRLLGPIGDEDMLGSAVDAQARHMPGQPMPQGQVAFADRVLVRQPRTHRVAEDACEGGRDRLQREQGGIGDAAGKRDDARLVQELQQLPNLRRRDAPSARRVELVPVRHGAERPISSWVRQHTNGKAVTAPRERLVPICITCWPSCQLCRQQFVASEAKATVTTLEGSQRP
jgi:hypothetical protein